jgi:anti-sigma B factor antagonist
MAERLSGRPPARLLFSRGSGLDELRISVTAGPAHTLITLAGECDLHTGRQLRDVLTSEVSRGAQRMILDLSGLNFMDSTGMQVLLSVRTVLNVRGGTLSVVAPQPVVARILELTGADQYIPVYSNLEDAQTEEAL